MTPQTKVPSRMRGTSLGDGGEQRPRLEDVASVPVPVGQEVVGEEGGIETAPLRPGEQVADLVPRAPHRWNDQPEAKRATPHHRFASSRQASQFLPADTAHCGPLKPSVNWVNPIAT